jgi:hypothetical protein
MRKQVLRKVIAAHLTRRAALAGLAIVAACKPAEVPLVPLVDGESQRVALPNGGHAWLSRFDISKIAIDHIAGDIDPALSKVGDYYPGSKSPAFIRIDAGNVLESYRATHGDKAQALINASFFERYDPATELSFPIKQDGKIITGGSSPYGPIDAPKDERYKKVILKALVWNDTSIKVVDYDHKTGGVLNDTAFPNGFVTYDYKDHPANVLAGDPVGQYQLMGTFPKRDGGSPDILFVVTIIKGRMVEGAEMLKRNGVAGTVLTVDGGPSTHLWTKANGVLIATESKTLPHFLGFRSRA